jgi:ABC-type uncharacterized transport system auxiliary subunit
VLQFSAPAKSAETADAVAAFDQALGKTLTDLVTWVCTALASPA